MVLGLLLSIVLLTLSFPTAFGEMRLPDMGFLVWVGWVPMLIAVRMSATKRIGRAAFAVCSGYYLLSMYWLFFAMHNFGGVSQPVAIAILVALCLFIGLYGATAFAIAGVLERRLRVPLLIALPPLWAFSEWCREHFPCGGYPWSNLAYSLGHDLYAMQLSEYIGVHGISALILFVNVAIAEGLSAWRMAMKGTEPASPWQRGAAYLAIAVAALALAHAVGAGRAKAVTAELEEIKRTRPPLSVALIQANVSQDDKWSSGEADRIRERFRRHSEAAFASGAELVIWPEAAYPYTIDKSVSQLDWFKAWMRDGYQLLTGGLTREYEDGIEKSYNSALWIDGDGQVIDQVDKVHLVPLGEYVPYRDHLTFARTLTQAVGNFYPGAKGHPLETPLGRFGILICYEDLFPDLSAALVKGGAEILVNLTNDAWYEKSSALYQHVVYSQYRALESRRYLLRATNTGITAVIDPVGRVVSSLPWYEEKVLEGKVWLISP